MPFHFWSVAFFVFGSMVGSFLNVCIHRMPLGQSIVSPPSHCPHCKYSIPWYLNIPLVTWLSLHGKCRNCGAPISIRYFLVELLTAVTFMSCWLAFGHQSAWLALVYALFLAGLIVATFIDFEHFIIPDEITVGGMVAGFVCSFLLPSLHDEAALSGSLQQSALGIAAGAGIIYFILRMGKLLFGRQKVALPADTKIIFSETAVHLPDHEIPYEELFYRQSDVITLQARTVELVDRCYKDVRVRLDSRHSADRRGGIEPGGRAASGSGVRGDRAAAGGDGSGRREVHGGHRRVSRVEGGDLLADGQLHDRLGGGRGPDCAPQARVVLAPALRPLHRAGVRDLAFRRQTPGSVVVWDVSRRQAAGAA